MSRSILDAVDDDDDYAADNINKVIEIGKMMAESTARVRLIGGLTTSTTTQTPPSAQFLTLTQTILKHVFSSKGYAHEGDWLRFVNYSAIRDRCFFELPPGVSVVVGEDGAEEQPNSIECTVQEAAGCLERFLHDENVHYFYIYIGFALFLITLAVLFNVIAIMAVVRCREKYPRHHVFISLSLSDLLLTTTLLLKRCGDQEEILDEATRDFLSNNVVVLFQIGYIMSAIGLLCLSLDNVLAIAAPYFYESLSRPLSTRILIGCLWAAAVTFAIVIRVCNVHTSLVVQIAVCVAMLVLLVVILSSYIFACAQSHVHRRRLAVMTENRRATDMRNQLRGFLTTGLLVFWCLLCWSPLVGYLLTDDDTLSSAHRFFTRYLVVALLVLHLNSVVDPVIYCLRLRDLRKSLFQMLGINSSKRAAARSNSAAQSRFSSSQLGGSRKSAPGYMHSESFRRSTYCADMSSAENSTVQAGLLLPSRILDGIDEAAGADEKSTTSPCAVSNHINFQIGDNNGSIASINNPRGRQTRAFSAVAVSSEKLPNGVMNGIHLGPVELKSLNGVAKQVNRQRNFQTDRAVLSLCDEKDEPAGSITVLARSITETLECMQNIRHQNGNGNCINHDDEKKSPNHNNNHLSTPTPALEPPEDPTPITTPVPVPMSDQNGSVPVSV